MKPSRVVASYLPMLFAAWLAACAPAAPTAVEPASTSRPSATAAPTGTAIPANTPMPTATSAPTATAIPTATATPAPAVSLLDNSTFLTIYGRAFGVAPVLGMLGGFKNMDEMEQGIQKYVEPIKKNNRGKPVVPTIHLIYGMAIPCEPNDNCLLYLDTAGVDVVKEYIEPAAKRGWHVILDSQNGRATPMDQVKRMIDRGYLKYDNVHVALDPEFASVPGRNTPGIPIGTMRASDINEVQKLLDDYVQQNRLKYKKMLMIHQFGDPNVDDGVPYMIQDKKSLKTYQNVDLVIDADGFGGPDSKVSKYNRMVDPTVYPMVKWRAIKLFYPNAHEQAGHYDKPNLTFEEVYGAKETSGGQRIEHEPHVIVIA